MERLRPRIMPAIVRILALISLMLLVGVPYSAHASKNWDGPAVTPHGGAPSILAQSGAAPVSTANDTSAGAANGATGASTSRPTTNRVISTARVTTPGNHGGAGTGAIGAGQARMVGGAGGSAVKTTTGTAGAVKSVAPTSPTLNLPPYAPPGSSGGAALDGSTIVGLVVKFLVVLVLLFIVLRVLKAIMPGGRAKRGGRERPMLLHSESIGDKQRVLLLDLGGKLVAVGVAGTSMTHLGTIEEAEAIDSVRARYAPLAEAVPGYQEGTAAMPLSQSFMETLKRAGIVGQRQAASGTTTPVTRPTPNTVTMPAVLRDLATLRTGNGRHTTRDGESRTRPNTQPPVEPILHDALEAMRAVRRRVEGA
jgi:flagellar biogenesis protein FliO